MRLKAPHNLYHFIRCKVCRLYFKRANRKLNSRLKKALYGTIRAKNTVTCSKLCSKINVENYRMNAYSKNDKHKK